MCFFYFRFVWRIYFLSKDRSSYNFQLKGVEFFPFKLSDTSENTYDQYLTEHNMRYYKYSSVCFLHFCQPWQCSIYVLSPEPCDLLFIITARNVLQIFVAARKVMFSHTWLRNTKSFWFSTWKLCFERLDEEAFKKMWRGFATPHQRIFIGVTWEDRRLCSTR